MNDDPILKEVRAAKEKIAREAEFDIHRLSERFRKAQEQYASRLVRPLPREKGSIQER